MARGVAMADVGDVAAARDAPTASCMPDGSAEMRARERLLMLAIDARARGRGAPARAIPPSTGRSAWANSVLARVRGRTAAAIDGGRTAGRDRLRADDRAAGSGRACRHPRDLPLERRHLLEHGALTALDLAEQAEGLVVAFLVCVGFRSMKVSAPPVSRRHSCDVGE